MNISVSGGLSGSDGGPFAEGGRHHPLNVTYPSEQLMN
jgi:hypothetical protein